MPDSDSRLKSIHKVPADRGAYVSVTNCVHSSRQAHCGDNPGASRRLSHARRVVVTHNYSRRRLQDLERGGLDSVYQFRRTSASVAAAFARLSAASANTQSHRWADPVIKIIIYQPLNALIPIRFSLAFDDLVDCLFVLRSAHSSALEADRSNARE